MSKEIKSVEEFNEVINQTCLVDFYTEDCPNCKSMEPVIESLDIDIPVYKFKVDMKISNAIRHTCMIMGAPTIVMFKDGIEKFRKVGFINKPELEDIVMVYK